MRTLFFVVIAAVLAYSAYWFIGAKAQETALAGWLDTQRQQGWVAETQDLTVRGYPSRFDVTATGLALADPRSGWAWQAPVFQILALSYQPNHVIAVWPGEQIIGTPLGNATITSETLRGSVKFVPNTRLTLDETAIEIADLSLTGVDGWEAEITSGLLATRRAEDGTAPDDAHDVSIDLQDVTLPSGLRDLIDKAGNLPKTLSEAKLQGTIAFDGPWDRLAIEGRKPRMTAASVTDLNVTWGVLNLKARGEVEVRADRYLDGNLDVTARNWRKMLQVAVAGGVLSADSARTVERGLGLIARLGGDERVINVPLRFSERITYLGPIPIGPAPRV